MWAVPPTPLRSRPDARRSAGFTLIELSIVIVIIAIIAALALFTLGAIRQKNAISLAPKQFMAVLNTARQEAMTNGTDVVFVMVGNTGPADATACSSPTQTPLPATSVKCVRYWLVEDLPTLPAGRFDYVNELPNFNLNTPFANPNRTPNADGDIVLTGGYLPTPIFLGKAPGYTVPPTPPANAVYRDLWTSNLFNLRPDCSFCITVGGAPRMAIRFDARGQMDILAPTNPRSGIVFFAAARNATDILPDTRTVALFEPFGIATDRLGSRIR